MLWMLSHCEWWTGNFWHTNDGALCPSCINPFGMWSINRKPLF